MLINAPLGSGSPRVCRYINHTPDHHRDATHPPHIILVVWCSCVVASASLCILDACLCVSCTVMSTNQLYDYTYSGRIHSIGVTSLKSDTSWFWVHSMVYDALGSFESLHVSSVSCVIYLVFSAVGLGAFVIVWLSVSLVLVTMSLSVSNCCISMSGGVVAVSSTLLWRCIHHVGWLSVWCRRSHHCLCIQCMWSGDHVSSVSDGGVHPGGVMRLVDSIM